MSETAFEQLKESVKGKIPSLITSFYKTKDGSLIEMVYSPVEETTALAVYKNGEVKYQQSISIDGKRIIPYSADNNLLRHKVVLFPSKAEEYNSETELLKEIQDFIYRYVDLGPFFQKLVPYYVLFSWVYDCFNEVPYLRFIGDTGSGKSRAVETIGSLCYKPIFAAGNASVSPIFRILDLFQGSLLIDEADYRFSDEKAEIIKILNCGNTKTFSVLRSESIRQKEFDPISFRVFGPKIFNTRSYFKDAALESRCITEVMDEKTLRDNIPINKPEDKFEQEALEIRNKLLMFRFKNYGKIKVNPGLVDKSVAPRLNQIIVPLASIISDQQALGELRSFVQEYNKQIISDRGMEESVQVLEAIKELISPNIETDIEAEQNYIKEITDKFIEKFGEEVEYRGKVRRVTPRWIGYVIRKDLKLKTLQTRDGYIIPVTEREKLNNLFKKYGLSQ